MNKVWKWILIGLGLFFLAFCVALPLFLGFGARMIGFGRMPMMGQPFGRFPMMGRGLGIFGGFHILGFLVPLFVLAVVILAIAGIVLLLRRPHKPAAATIAPAASTGTVLTVDAPPSEPVPSAAASLAEVIETTPCLHCGASVQTGWVACPHCGERLT